ncbi:MAG TPA: YdcH family protein [Methylomirabilota bacterium]|jgi:uncharacterized protein YdcH (DUF465 family)|nr:YdcH family protein [Methylomirabilota bacterium]
MSNLQRNPGDFSTDGDLEYEKLAQQHSAYEEQLKKISDSAYLNSEDLLEEVRLKKLKLRVKDQMELLRRRSNGNAPH